MQDIDLEAALGRLAQAIRNERMVLAQERPDDEHAVEVAQLRDRHPEPGNATQLAFRREISLAQAEIHGLAAEAANELLREVQLFERRLRRGQRANVGAGRLEACHHAIQRGLPVGLLPLPVLLHHRRSQSLGRVQAFIREAIPVRDPALVDGLVLQGQYAHDLVLLHLHYEVRTQAVMRRNALATGEFPGPGRVAERLGGQRADRADVDHVAGKFGLHRLAHKRDDLGVFAAADHAEFHLACDFLAEAHAAGALDATAHLLGCNQRSDVLVQHHALFFLVARSPLAVADRQVLQLAFAALVTDRAVERVVDEQELHHPLLRLLRVFGVRLDLHAVGARRCTGRQRLGRLLDLDKAHAAVGRNRELLVVAEVRHVDAELVGRLHHGCTVLDLHFPAVDFDLEHVRIPMRPWPRGATPGARRTGPTWVHSARPKRGSVCARCDIRTRRGSA